MDFDMAFGGPCHELHIGNTPRSIMTKGNSTRRKNRLPGSLYRNCDLGNNDKLMITYRRERLHDYTMHGACGVLFEGEMHFFGGYDIIVSRDYTELNRSLEYETTNVTVKGHQKSSLTKNIFLKSSCSKFFSLTNYFSG